MYFPGSGMDTPMARRHSRLATYHCSLSLIGYMLFCTSGTALAQQAGSPQGVSNDQALQSWQQGAPGEQTAQLVSQDDGSTRIEWHGSLAVDAYANTILNSNGSMNSPMVTGTFGKSVMFSDLRGISPTGDMSHFQLGMTNSNDRAVLSLYPRQINNVQVGRTGPGYLVAAGDVMPYYSSLSSMLAVRGANGQYQLGDVVLHGYAGVVSESWEALEGLIVRSQFLRDVRGAKVEYSLNQAMKLFATTQSGSDREGSVTHPGFALFAKPSRLRSHSLGFQFAEGAWQLSGESAASHFEQQGQEARSGRANVLDGSWRGSTVSLRAGFHEIDPRFATLSMMAMAGITETYVGGDWMADSWLTLGADRRNTKQTTLASFFAPQTTSDTDSSALRANINFGPDLPGWGLSLQSNDSRTTNAQTTRTRMRQDAASINYYSSTWMSSFGYSLGQMRNQAFPASDSNTESWNLGLGRSFSDANDAAPASWSVNINLNASLQQQHVLAGGGSRNVNYMLSVTGQREGWGQFALFLNNGQMSGNPLLPGLKARGAQLEASRPISASSNVKLYLRNNQRNVGDPISGATERVAGLQITHQF